MSIKGEDFMSAWKTDNWQVSPIDFINEVTASLATHKKPAIHDATLRDGLESVGVVFGREEKVEVAKALDDFGISRIEVGLGTSVEEMETVKIIANSGLKAKIFTFRTIQEGRAGIDLALKYGITHVVSATYASDTGIKSMGLTREQVIAQIIDTVTYAKAHGMYVNFFTIDSTRADLDFLLQAVSVAANEAHADSVSLVDSFGVTNPEAIRYLTKKYIEAVKGKVPVEIHCHNDFGLGLANAIAGYNAGADVIHASFNGLGNRAGNPATEEVAVCLRVLYGADLNLKYEKLFSVCKLVEKLSKWTLANNKPISGSGVFATESGATFTNMGKPSCSPYNPGFIGQVPELVFAKRSDIKAVQEKLRQMNVTATEDQMKTILKRVQEHVSKYKRALTNEEFDLIARCST